MHRFKAVLPCDDRDVLPDDKVHGPLKISQGLFMVLKLLQGCSPDNEIRFLTRVS